MGGQLTPRSLYPGRNPLCHSVRALLGTTAKLIAAETWPGTEPRFFCRPAPGVVTEPTELFRPLYFVKTSEQSLEIRVTNQPYP
jgi:hypothetical protein